MNHLPAISNCQASVPLSEQQAKQVPELPKMKDPKENHLMPLNLNLFLRVIHCYSMYCWHMKLTHGSPTNLYQPLPRLWSPAAKVASLVRDCLPGPAGSQMVTLTQLGGFTSEKYESGGIMIPKIYGKGKLMFQSPPTSRSGEK